MGIVFVYGSLKQGFSNHHFLLDAQYLGPGTTKQSDYRLVSLGPYPAVLNGGKHAICGELYQVDSETLVSLDELEEYPSVYGREKVAIIDQQGHEVEAWIYFLVAQLDFEEPDFDLPNSLTWSSGLQVVTNSPL